MRTVTACACLVLLSVLVPGAQERNYEPVERLARFEVTLEASGAYQNPYVEVDASAVFTRPDGSQWEIPLFWNGGNQWCLRISPDLEGCWTFLVRSNDQGLNETRGRFLCSASGRTGAMQPMASFPYHFGYQDGSPVWFMGDTAWALFTDDTEERHDRKAVQAYIDARAAQGFTVLHAMLLSEAGWGNSGGPPFTDIQGRVINPGYWKEVDERVDYMNRRGLIGGLALAWGDKRGIEPFSWKRLGNLEAKRRYARYIAARYAAFNVYFIVAGEWHAEVRTTPGATEESIRPQFIEVGQCLQEADPHERMIAIHPMTGHGSVREFNQAAGWMSFGDYQQNYLHLHQRILESRVFNKPVVNSEYGYHLRDADGDGVPDKENSTSLDNIRHATWDIVMAGGYFVTGFGTTYFGGHRDPGRFDLHAEKNRDWEDQAGHLKELFSRMDWWKLEPHDEILRSEAGRTSDRKHLNRPAPPERTYWCLAEPGRRYVVYVRGTTLPVEMDLGMISLARVRLYDPRTGKSRQLQAQSKGSTLDLVCPNEQDWVFLIDCQK
jgi:hypothetical protein